MADEPPQTDVSSHPDDEENKRYCWVCYATDEDDETAPWVKPCKCRGTTKWVHQSCLQRWVDEKQKGNSTVKVNCPQCGVAYFIAFPNMGPASLRLHVAERRFSHHRKQMCSICQKKIFPSCTCTGGLSAGQLMLFLDRVDTFIYKVCPFVAAGVVVGSIYWTAVTYGAITVMQVVGYQEGMALMEQADPLVLLVGLPTIPIFLILGKMVRWEDKVLRLIRASVQRLPFLKYLLPAFRYEETTAVSTTAVISDPVNATRVLCGALSLPTLATIAGRLFFPSTQDNLNRTLLGGATFLLVKGLFKVYYKQQQHVMQSRRKIIDYPQDVSSQAPTNSGTSTTTAEATTEPPSSTSETTSDATPPTSHNLSSSETSCTSKEAASPTQSSTSDQPLSSHD